MERIAAELSGPESSPYEGGIFRVQIEITPRFVLSSTCSSECGPEGHLFGRVCAVASQVSLRASQGSLSDAGVSSQH